MLPVDILVIGVACFAAYLVYGISEAALKQFSALQLPKIIPLAVSLLTLMAIVELGRGIVLLLLIPYAALGLALVVLYFMGRCASRSNSRAATMLISCVQFLQRTLRACARRVQEVVKELGQRNRR